MKQILTIVLIFIGINVFGQADEEYGTALKKLFEVNGTNQTYQSAIKQMIIMYKQQNQDVSAEVWDEFENEFLKISLDDLSGMLVPVYSKYLTLDDLKVMIAFYETPVGKKYAANAPVIMQESMQVGALWGAKIGEDFAKRIQEGID